ncbi:hypothetical protein WMY93_014200 [Mugilogobius chulae]|uniref:Uncharacterized protein n=1 Tax=Mugilogobius chulae TaxID=88201 RepID=A0AAW0NYD4_9GOBI
MDHQSSLMSRDTPLQSSEGESAGNDARLLQCNVLENHVIAGCSIAISLGFFFAKKNVDLLVAPGAEQNEQAGHIDPGLTVVAVTKGSMINMFTDPGPADTGARSPRTSGN